MIAEKVEEDEADDEEDDEDDFGKLAVRNEYLFSVI